MRRSFRSLAFLPLAVALSGNLLAAEAPAAPPAVYFEAYRLDASGREELALDRLRAALRAEPENPFLHFARLGIGSNGSERPYLEADYRAFLAASPSSPFRRLLLSATLARVAQPPDQMNADPAKVTEAKSLLDGVPDDGSWEPWRTMTAAIVLSVDDPKAYGRLVKEAWEKWPGHPAFATWMASRVDRDEAKLLPVVLTAAKKEPRPVWRMLKGHTAPLDPKAANDMAALLRLLRKATAARPDDVDLALSLRAALFLDGRAKELPVVDAVIARLDPAFPLPAQPAAPSAEKGEPPMVRFLAAMELEGQPRVTALEALLAEKDLPKGLERTASEFLDSSLREVDPKNPKRRLPRLARAVELGTTSTFVISAYARVAAETGERIDEATKVLEAALARALGAEPPPGEQEDGGPMMMRGGLTEELVLADLLAARAALRRRAGNDRAARGDLRLAVALQPESPLYLAELAEVDEKLGRNAEALSGWTAANARAGADARPEWKERFAAAAARRYLWAKPEELAAAAKAELSAAKGEKKEFTHPLVGRPAPAFDLAGLGGGRVSLAAHAGKPVVLDFWATWCKPCRMEMKAIAPVVLEYTKKGVVFLALSTDSDDDWKNKVPGFVKEQQIAMTVARADDATQSAYRVSGIPLNVVIGKDGNIRQWNTGYGDATIAELRKLLDAALE